MSDIPKENIDDGLGIDEETRLKAYAGASLPVALVTAVAIGIFTPQRDGPTIDAIRASTDMVTNPDRPHEYVVIEGSDPAQVFQIASRINMAVDGSLTGFSQACRQHQDDGILEKHIKDRDGIFAKFGCQEFTTWLCNDNGTVTEQTPRDPVICKSPRRHRRDRASK